MMDVVYEVNCLPLPSTTTKVFSERATANVTIKTNSLQHKALPKALLFTWRHWIVILSSNSESLGRLCIWQNALGNFISYCYLCNSHCYPFVRKGSSCSRESSTLGAEIWVQIPSFPNYWLCDWEQVTWFLWAAGCFCKYNSVGTRPSPSLTSCQQLLSQDNNKDQRLWQRLYGPASRNLTLNPGHLFTIWSFPEEICNHRAPVFSQTRPGLQWLTAVYSGAPLFHPESSFREVF